MLEIFEELSAKRDQSEKQIHYWKAKKKILKHQVSTLTCKTRPHRLCTCGGMLDSFLICPRELTNDTELFLSMHLMLASSLAILTSVYRNPWSYDLRGRVWTPLLSDIVLLRKGLAFSVK